MNTDRLLAAFAGFVAVPTLLSFLYWVARIAVGGMAVLAGFMPVMVAEPTGSMNPAIDGGDRLVHDTGLGDVERGDVIVYSQPDGPVTSHRATFYVEKGENWYDRANASYVGDADSCEELANCPAPHAGWVTRGDSNPRYDQAAGRTPPVRDEWIRGRVVATVDPDGWTITRLSG